MTEYARVRACSGDCGCGASPPLGRRQVLPGQHVSPASRLAPACRPEPRDCIGSPARERTVYSRPRMVRANHDPYSGPHAMTGFLPASPAILETRRQQPRHRGVLPARGGWYPVDRGGAGGGPGRCLRGRTCVLRPSKLAGTPGIPAGPAAAPGQLQAVAVVVASRRLVAGESSLRRPVVPGGAWRQDHEAGCFNQHAAQAKAWRLSACRKDRPHAATGW